MLVSSICQMGWWMLSRVQILIITNQFGMLTSSIARLVLLMYCGRWVILQSASISKKVLKVLVYMCTKFGTFFIKCTIDLGEFRFSYTSPFTAKIIWQGTCRQWTVWQTHARWFETMIKSDFSCFWWHFPVPVTPSCSISFSEINLLWRWAIVVVEVANVNTLCE